MIFLKNLQEFEDIPSILYEPVFNEAFEIAKVLSFTREELRAYQQSLKVYRDDRNKINSALIEGRDEGVAIGLEIGIEIGEYPGKLANAKSLLGLIDDITLSERLNLPLDVIQGLK